MKGVSEATIVNDHIALDLEDDEELIDVVTGIVKLGGQVGEVKKVRQSLEEAYVQLMGAEQ